MPSPVEPGTTLFEYDEQAGAYVEWSVCDLVYREAGVSAILSRGDRRATIDADALAAAVTDAADPSWVPAVYDGTDADGDASWVAHPRHRDPAAAAAAASDLPVARRTAPASSDLSVARRTAPASPTALTFEKIEGRGSRREVNAFLDGAGDGLVFHQLGGVASWKAAFAARYEGALVSAVVLHHYHPSTNGSEIAVTRLANHECAPPNTASWMLAKARDWAERAGYDRIAAYAGVDGNDGTCYRAAGFEPVGDPEVVSGTSWTASDDDGGDGDGDGAAATWRKQKYVDDLEPEQYADKPASWAVETVADRVVVPGRDAGAATAETDEVTGT